MYCILFYLTVDVLPDTYTTPLYFTPDEISLLRGSSTYESSIGMQRSIARQYAYFWALFINQADKYPTMAKNFTYDQYRYGVFNADHFGNDYPTHKKYSPALVSAILAS